MRRKKGRGMRTMERLTDLPNIGPKLAENLEKAGIKTPDHLRELGVEPSELSGVFITHEHSDHVCGLGVAGLLLVFAHFVAHKRLLSPERKAELKAWFRSL